MPNVSPNVSRWNVVVLGNIRAGLAKACKFNTILSCFFLASGNQLANDFRWNMGLSLSGQHKVWYFENSVISIHCFI